MLDILSGNVLGSVPISGTATGKSPGQSDKCASTFGTGGYGPISFTSDERQRAALLLLNGNTVYVAFAPGGDTGEYLNGWLFGYKFASGSFSQVEVVNTTPYGTGGGIWGSGGGLSAELRNNTTPYIYVSTGNGTYDLSGATPIASDIGDSAMKFAMGGSTGALSPVDYYTPADINTYVPPGGSTQGVCQNDADFGSGSILVFPETFYTDTNHGTTPNLSVIGDKQSTLYVLNRDSMGHFNPAGGNLVEFSHVRYDHMNQPQSKQGFWSTPAYWKYMDGSTPRYRLYAGVTSQDTSVGPFPMDMYALLTSGSSGPIPGAPTTSTGISFCRYAPQPIVSSNGTIPNTGIVRGIEKLNADFPNDCASTSGTAVLDAFNATNMSQLFSSRGLLTVVGSGQTFATPTVFNGRVYVISYNHLAVFGPCTSYPGGCKQ